MKLGRVEAWNFGSYAHLELDLSDTGLSLVYGKTGSGKSTIPDIPCWILFGVTSKNGAADDVRSWASPNEPTKGVLDVQLHEGSIQITRIRGKSGQNDLYWTESKTPDKRERGKDTSETQRHIVDRIGVDSSLYLNASYFCDFSSSGHFFTAKAKDRRELFEKIAQLDLPVQIAERTSEARKIDKKGLEKSELELSKLTGKLEQLNSSHADLHTRYGAWEQQKDERLSNLKYNVILASNKFVEYAPGLEAKITFIKEELNQLYLLKPELDKASESYTYSIGAHNVFQQEYNRLQSVNSNQCPTCLSPQASNTNRHDRLKVLSKEIKRTLALVMFAKEAKERISLQLSKERELTQEIIPLQVSLDELSKNLKSAQRDLASLEQENPFHSALVKTSTSIIAASKDKTLLEASIASQEHRISSLSLLYDMSFSLRGELLKKAVKDIEASANAYLEKYFDAELRVTFSIEGSDDLEVSIQKSGFACNFKQLSKGQRQLLKLCFAVSIMKASSNSAGVHFDNLFFDEALDGMDESLKVKAYDLFSELSTEHESILVIEHAESFQNMFSNRYRVDMIGDISAVELEHD